jgi:uncharacterized iron-regulated protein
MARRDFLGALGLVALLPGCAVTGGPAGAGGAAFYDAGSGERLSRRRLLRQMEPAPIVMLGEVHDNTGHHRLRGALLLDWVCSRPSRPAAIVFEQLDREYNDDLRRAQKRRSQGRERNDAEMTQLLEAARFNAESWGWPAHLPLFQAAQASGATWIAANLSRSSAQRLGRGADDEVEPVLKAVVDSARWSEDAQHALDRALMQGHCNLVAPQALAGIARLQRLRDAALALPLLDAAERRSVLVAGNGHVRRDHGVPLYLGALEREALVVGFEEVAGQASASALAEAVGTSRAAEFGRAYDIVCLTTQAPRDDPCEQLESAPSNLQPGEPAAVNPGAPMRTPSR